ncbi:MAG TPA: ABC transporter permease [Gemmatimonadaceae bacterium]|nr:ABC transporter permease [Gemmatimonadaceae bacterium]
MSLLRHFTAGLRSLFQRDQVSRALDEEISVYLEMEAAEKRKQGMNREQALRSVRLERGTLQAAKEVVRSGGWESVVESCGQDLRFGLRMLRKNPGFTSAAVLTLAIGIGATTAVFSIIEAVLLRPLPYYDAGRLAVLWTDNVKKSLHQERTSYPNFEDWQKQNTTFEDMAFASAFTVNATAGEELDRLTAGRVSANLFSLMGVRPLLGRTFSRDEERRGERVVVVSQGLWQRWFGSSREIAGRTLEVDGARMAIVGVMPSTFEFPAKNVDLWEPLTVFPSWNALEFARNTPSGFVVGRLRPGVSVARAQADMDVIAAHLASAHPDLATNLDFFGFQVNVVPFKSYFTGSDVRTALWLLFGAVVLVLIIACTNVASLLLSRIAARFPELATRAALGAGGKRIARQLLTETALLYLVSAALGIAIAAGADRLLIGLAPTEIPRLREAGIDVGVVSFALGLSCFAVFSVGLFPALRISALEPHLAVTGSGRRHSQTSTVVRLRSLLVTGELAVAVILLVGSGLLIRSFLRVQQVDPGFTSDHVLTLRVVQSKSKSETQWRESYEQAIENIRAMRGVQAIGAIDNFFFASFPDETVIAEGHAQTGHSGSLSQVTDDGISPGFFQALGVPLLRGRLFTEHDEVSSPRAAIINATMARRFWPGEDPVGKRFKFAYQADADPWTTVVGVVADMHRDGLTRDAVSEIFLPLAQHPARGMDLVVRTSADPRGFAAAVRDAFRSADKTAPVFNVSTLADALREQLAPRRFQTLLLSLFSCVAVLLAAIGICGLIYYSTTQRTQEIGIRMALGAQPLHVLRLVAHDAARSVLSGIALGLGGALAAERVLSSELFGVTSTDPVSFIGVTLLLCVVASAACYVPARRAMRVDPMIALRPE